MFHRSLSILVCLSLVFFEKSLPAAEGPSESAPAGTSASPPTWLQSDSWAATDALGRALPSHAHAGPRRTGKHVALFYWTWHVDGQVKGEPVNVNLVTTLFPKAINDYEHPIWKRLGTGYHWDEPLFGYYRATDPWVLRKHAEMLADAGVDVIVFDATNGSLTWKNSYEVLFPVFEQARKDGVRAPSVAFMLPFGPWPHSLESITQLYEEVYKPGRFKDLWFQWKGKPLIMAYPDNVPEPINSFFTFRPGQPVYKTGPERPDHWGWLEIAPQHGFVKTESGGFEQVTVGVAQNATDTLWPAAMNDPDVSYGRGYTVKHGQNHSPQAVASGLNFQEQWDRALELDPELVFVTGWNEWIAGRYKEWQKTENAFPDQFNAEFSRDIEPMKGGFGDNYYYQLIANIRRFKGVAPPERPSGPVTIALDGDFADWDAVRPEYHDYRGDTLRRDHPGYGNRLVYVNATGRNDIVRAKVARDVENVYFHVSTAEPITPPEGRHWMVLLIDVDSDKKTGWEGYDVAVNRIAPDGEDAFFEVNSGEWKWQIAGTVPFRVNGSQMELAIPRAFLGDDAEPLDFEFKWSDNIRQEGDVMEFYRAGDAAPSGRFNYVFSEKPTP